MPGEKDLDPAETLFRLRSIPTSFRPASGVVNRPAKGKLDMKNSAQCADSSHLIKTLLRPALWRRLHFLILGLALACFGLSPHARAVCQEGCLTINNTVLGDDALLNNTSGFDNTAIGFRALLSNTSGSDNTAIGYQALNSNTFGVNNTATGLSALLINTSGSDNTASGAGALLNNTTGFDNTASGAGALVRSTTGFSNTATGRDTLSFNTTGSENMADGVRALYKNTIGSDNTAIGVGALYSNKTGSNNIALGVNAGRNLTKGSNNIAIGNKGVRSESGVIRFGTEGTQVATYVAGISGVTVANGVGVVVGPDGQLGIMTSSPRYKEAIKPMDKASEAILALKPVTFRYKKELDPEAIPQFGLVAEDVAKIDPDLVARDNEGKPYTVRYEAVNAMLLNEFIKEHHRIEQQGTRIAQLEAAIAQEREASAATAGHQQKEIDKLSAALREQSALLQKVNDQLELKETAPRVVAND
jgi:hypothetical protein